MARTLILSALLLLAAGTRCNANRPRLEGRDVHVIAAHALTQRYAASRFHTWNIKATAGGGDCSVLVLQTEIILDDSMIEAMHYGAGQYDTYSGGLQRFMREHDFRGMAYKDVSGRIWTYGKVSPSEAETLVPCR